MSDLEVSFEDLGEEECERHKGGELNDVDVSSFPSRFDSKLDIEAFLRTSVPDFPWTILQPVYL